MVTVEQIVPDAGPAYDLYRGQVGAGWESSLSDLKKYLEGPRERRVFVEAGLPGHARGHLLGQFPPDVFRLGGRVAEENGSVSAQLLPEGAAEQLVNDPRAREIYLGPDFNL